MVAPRGSAEKGARDSVANKLALADMGIAQQIASDYMKAHPNNPSYLTLIRINRTRPSSSITISDALPSRGETISAHATPNGCFIHSACLNRGY